MTTILGKGLKALNEDELAALDMLPESIRTSVKRDIERKVHTVRHVDYDNIRVQAKVGESGRVIVVQVQQIRDGKWIQGQRPSLQFRPRALDEMRHYMGSMGSWLGDYLDQAREAGLIDDGSDE